MWVVLLVLASCQDGAEEAGPNGAVPAGYPNLHTVPSRPELSYTVEQRRAKPSPSLVLRNALVV